MAVDHAERMRTNASRQCHFSFRRSAFQRGCCHDSAGIGRSIDAMCGTGYGCSVADTNQVTCWGSLALPTLGTIPVRDVQVGRDFSCARLNGIVKCWGNNDFSQLGESATNPEGQWARGPEQAQQIAVGTSRMQGGIWQTGKRATS